jgi:hypothetical protein
MRDRRCRSNAALFATGEQGVITGIFLFFRQAR